MGTASKKVVAATLKPQNAASVYWLVLEGEGNPEIPCTSSEYWLAKNTLNSGGIHVVATPVQSR